MSTYPESFITIRQQMYEKWPTQNLRIKKKITRAKLVAKQRVGFPLMSKVMLEVPLRSSVLNLMTKVT